MDHLHILFLKTVRHRTTISGLDKARLKIGVESDDVAIRVGHNGAFGLQVEENYTGTKEWFDPLAITVPANVARHEVNELGLDALAFDRWNNRFGIPFR